MKKYNTGNRINKVEFTDEILTGRGGLSLFVRYLEKVCIYDILDERFGRLRKSLKGIPAWNLFKQVFCFFFDGTSRYLVYFDHLKDDGGYSATIENDFDSMASSQFRKGSRHGNHPDTVLKMVEGLVKLIRKRYREDVEIIVRMDSGFFYEDNFKGFDDPGIGFIATGKIYEGVKEQVSGMDEVLWGEYDNGHQKWSYVEFGWRGGWKRFWRAFYTRPFY